MDEPNDRNEMHSGEDVFEQQLARALRRVEVRAETSAKFYALAAEAEQKRVEAGSGPRLVKLSNGGRVIAFPQARNWAMGALAALLLLSVFPAERAHVRRQERARAEQDFATAERIEAQTLAQVRQQIQQAGISMEP